MWSDKGHKGQAYNMCPVNTYHNQTIGSSSFINNLKFVISNNSAILIYLPQFSYP